MSSNWLFRFSLRETQTQASEDFFPELNSEVLKTGLQAFILELERLKAPEKKYQNTPFLFDEAAKAEQQRFRELVRPRETLLHFSEIGTAVTPNPSEKLKELFAFYIKRQFANDREYQEIIMRSQLGEFLQQKHLAHFYRSRTVGDDNYHVTFPFVYEKQGQPMKAIKPLHLDKKESTEIYRHGDFWISSVRRLRDANRLPKELLFAVKTPKTHQKNIAAANDSCGELLRLDAIIAPFGEKTQILNFAKV